MKKHFLYYCFIFSGIATHAQSSSYLYIESSTKNPFYITIDSNRYQRHFNSLQIVPELLEGPMMVSIQLQNQTTESYHFYLNMPAAAHRSFLLEKNQENDWVLFDLEHNYSLHANNEQEDQLLFINAQRLQSK